MFRHSQNTKSTEGIGAFVIRFVDRLLAFGNAAFDAFEEEAE
jgi:hypothetical protein